MEPTAPNPSPPVEALLDQIERHALAYRRGEQRGREQVLGVFRDLLTGLRRAAEASNDVLARAAGYAADRLAEAYARAATLEDPGAPDAPAPAPAGSTRLVRVDLEQARVSAASQDIRLDGTNYLARVKGEWVRGCFGRGGPGVLLFANPGETRVFRPGSADWEELYRIDDGRRPYRVTVTYGATEDDGPRRNRYIQWFRSDEEAVEKTLGARSGREVTRISRLDTQTVVYGKGGSDDE